MDTLADLGRTALSAEGTLWRTLFAVLFADLYFLPVPGALPTRFLTGPVDLGTPQFEARRRDEIQALFASIRSGNAEELIRDAWSRWYGCALTGAVWSVVSESELMALATGLGPEPLVAMLQHLLRHGLRSTSGLPDLVVLEGPVARIDGFPSRIPTDLFCIEVKGPTDSLRDGQRVWLDRLVSMGVLAEVWHVDERA
jgi:Fanconi-associated nuclease 1